MSEVSTGAGLLPCPFCGETEKVCLQNGNIPLGTGWHSMVWCVSCGSLSGERAAEAEAIAAWNQRATPEPAGDLVERVKDALQSAYISGAQDVHDAWVNCGGHSPGDRDDLGEGASDYVASIDVAAIAAMPDREAELERLKDENKNLSHHAVSGVLGDLLDLAEREALLDFIKYQRGLPDTRDEHISTLRTQLAASQADVARLRDAIERARKAPMIDHRDAANSVYGILEAAIKDTQP